MEIITGKQVKPPRILLYGTDGVGKSTWAAHAPKPIFLQTEDRLSHIDCHRMPLAESLPQVVEQLNFITRNPGDYKTLVIDSLDWLEKLMHKEIADNHGLESIGDLAFGKGYAQALAKWDRLISKLEAIWAKGMNIILIAHAHIKKFEDPQRESYDQYKPALHDKAANRLQQWVDCVFFADFKIYTKKSEGKFGGEQVKGFSAGERVIYTEERGAFQGKNSYNLPFELPMEFSAFAKAYGDWKGKEDKEKKETK